MINSGESGVLNIDKPSGRTSRAVVDQAENRVRDAKIGHAGTLDRQATGVLPLMVNEATKLVPYLQKQPKTYLVTARFDRCSNTLDMDGDVESVKVDRQPAQREIDDALERFQGEIEQVPPRYSALKKDGQRLAERAEQGEEVDPDPRTVTCDTVVLKDLSWPRVTLRVTCGKGFYVRSLVRDLAAELTLDGGVVSDLVRTAYGPFCRDDAVTVDTADPSTGWHPPVKAVEQFYRVECDRDDLDSIHHGAQIPRRDQDHEWGYAVDETGRLHAVLKADSHRGLPKWQPDRVLNRSSVPAS